MISESHLNRKHVHTERVGKGFSYEDCGTHSQTRAEGRWQQDGVGSERR